MKWHFVSLFEIKYNKVLDTKIKIFARSEMIIEYSSVFFVNFFITSRAKIRITSDKLDLYPKASNCFVDFS